MTEVIIGQLENKSYFSKEDKSIILSCFLMTDDEKNSFTVDNSFYRMIHNLESGEKSLEYFLERFKVIQPLINMFMYQKLHMIDQ